MPNAAIIAAFKAEHLEEYNAIAETGVKAATDAGVLLGVAQEKDRATKAGAVEFSSKDYIATFGDAGARAFLEGKSFVTCSTEATEKMKVDHKLALEASAAQVATAKAETETVKAKLAAMPRGNDPATFQAEPNRSADGSVNTAAPKPLDRKYADGREFGTGGGLDRFASGIVLPGQPGNNGSQN